MNSLIMNETPIAAAAAAVAVAVGAILVKQYHRHMSSSPSRRRGLLLILPHLGDDGDVENVRRNPGKKNE